MWPWGHLAFGYVLFSLTARGLFGESPRSPAVYLLLLGTQLPDLVDKPLSWVFGVFPSGYSVAHSVFVAVPVALAVAALAARGDHLAAGVAFGVGWWSHLVGDLLVAVVEHLPFVWARVLWPVVTIPPYEHRMGALQRIAIYLGHFLAELRASHDPTLLVLYLGPFAFAGLLWLVDGAPGFPTAWLRPERTG